MIHRIKRRVRCWFRTRKSPSFGHNLNSRYHLALLICLALNIARLEVNGDQVIADGVIFTSIIRLIAHPKEYEGKKVMILGFYSRGRELSSLYLSREDARYGNTQSAVWIDLGGAETNKLVNTKITSSEIRVVGTFHSDSVGSGHMGAWPSEIKDLKLLQKP